MSFKRIAVTGGSGRIGRHLVRMLVERGHEVLNLDRRPSAERLGRFVFVDLRVRSAVQPILETVDAVCHLGEIPHEDFPVSWDEIFAHNTAVGSVVLQSAADLGLKRVVITSTCQVYGCWGREPVPFQSWPITETHPFAPTNVYAMSKVANEGYARVLAHRMQMSVAIVRFPWVVPWDLEQEESSRYLAGMERRADLEDGFGTYLLVRDAALAYIHALEHPRPGCEAYHFSAADVLCTTPLRQALAAGRPSYPPLPLGWGDYASPLDCTKAREHLDWQPTGSVREFFRRRFGREMGRPMAGPGPAPGVAV